MRSVINGLWSTYQLRITTPRLQLRLPNDDELAQLAALAGQGVHPPSERDGLHRAQAAGVTPLVKVLG